MFYSRDLNIRGLSNLINHFKPTSKLIRVFYLIVFLPLISRYRRLIVVFFNIIMVFFWAKVSLRPLIIVVALSTMSTILLYVVTSRSCYFLA
jgi:energy-coupling factor transporter transmembrane protein EcfT